MVNLVICPACHGQGRVIIRRVQILCVDCHGSGRVHCCEGEQAQPEKPPAQARGGRRPQDDWKIRIRTR